MFSSSSSVPCLEGYTQLSQDNNNLWGILTYANPKNYDVIIKPNTEAILPLKNKSTNDDNCMQVVLDIETTKDNALYDEQNNFVNMPSLYLNMAMSKFSKQIDDVHDDLKVQKYYGAAFKNKEGEKVIITNYSLYEVKIMGGGYKLGRYSLYYKPKEGNQSVVGNNVNIAGGKKTRRRIKKKRTKRTKHYKRH